MPLATLIAKPEANFERLAAISEVIEAAYSVKLNIMAKVESMEDSQLNYFKDKVKAAGYTIESITPDPVWNSRPVLGSAKRST